ncbi:Uma2 family endonuclease [Streptomyces caniscabiei]|uniref:Uma2 family endonuclease n=1 Tax=Streptomyces caniscabiei TaxID=2746961 RepID=A0ABU4MIQ4_9ACTN|nr:Uma2 family endonuclease [Streptomyces caniscabiei]MBE4735249.1 Uma2 family endonuclease [Streptomyces caniscabiei]MBE4754383.1 Uma2 family endonuclease [Streptomyces caniscabiei]MBE4784431.1 Uma2 family endonuclease [Streptomyces caniscabiei]MBE4791070.1 Uma2 family endonuclease [Streptomyces caniscabiei]MDX2941104.1 Uma2 family endonuclease [Streptomyces caniscabiei]
MTPTPEHRPQMSVEEFEELERHAPEMVRLEFIRGKVQVKPVTDGNHDHIVAWLQRLCMQHRPELWLYGDRGMKVEEYRKGRARPDGLLAPFGFPMGHGDWSDTEGVLMVVEVTSHDSDTHQRDRVEKPDGYAAAGIPVYLLIDRDDCSVVVFNQPEGGRYQHEEKFAFGATVKLPDPVNISLDTEHLKEYAD